MPKLEDFRLWAKGIPVKGMPEPYQQKKKREQKPKMKLRMPADARDGSDHVHGTTAGPTGLANFMDDHRHGHNTPFGPSSWEEGGHGHSHIVDIKSGEQAGAPIAVSATKVPDRSTGLPSIMVSVGDMEWAPVKELNVEMNIHTHQPSKLTFKLDSSTEVPDPDRGGELYPLRDVLTRDTKRKWIYMKVGEREKHGVMKEHMTFYGVIVTRVQVDMATVEVEAVFEDHFKPEPLKEVTPEPGKKGSLVNIGHLGWVEAITPTVMASALTFGISADEIVTHPSTGNPMPLWQVLETSDPTWDLVQLWSDKHPPQNFDHMKVTQVIRGTGELDTVFTVEMVYDKEAKKEPEPAVADPYVMPKGSLLVNIGVTGWVKAENLNPEPDVIGEGGRLSFTVDPRQQVSLSDGEAKSMMAMLQEDARKNAFLVEVSIPAGRRTYHDCKILVLDRIDVEEVLVAVRYKRKQ